MQLRRLRCASTPRRVCRLWGPSLEPNPATLKEPFVRKEVEESFQQARVAWQRGKTIVLEWRTDADFLRKAWHFQALFPIRAINFSAYAPYPVCIEAAV